MLLVRFGSIIVPMMTCTTCHAIILFCSTDEDPSLFHSATQGIHWQQLPVNRGTVGMYCKRECKCICDWLIWSLLSVPRLYCIFHKCIWVYVGLLATSLCSFEDLFLVTKQVAIWCYSTFLYTTHWLLSQASDGHDFFPGININIEALM